MHIVYTCMCIKMCGHTFTVSFPSLPVPTVHNNSASSPQHWSNISIGHSVEWPQERSSHSATHLSGSKFVIVGGVSLLMHRGPNTLLNDMWLCDTTSKLWKKVYNC